MASTNRQPPNNLVPCQIKRNYQSLYDSEIQFRYHSTVEKHQHTRNNSTTIYFHTIKIRQETFHKMMSLEGSWFESRQHMYSHQKRCNKFLRNLVEEQSFDNCLKSPSTFCLPRELASPLQSRRLNQHKEGIS